MKTFGYKFAEKHAFEVEPVINAAIAEHRPLEVGFYFADPAAWEIINALLPDATIPVNIHLNHDIYGVFTIDKHEAALHQQLAQAKSIRSDYAITHLHTFPTNQRPEFRAELAAHLTPRLQLMNRIAAEYDHPIHIENTFHNLAFYRWFFELVTALDLPYIHQCFDLGHAKLWSTDTFSAWLAWLQEQTAKGFHLHFHLHANNGLTDQHLAFTEAKGQGLTQADSYTQRWDYFQVLHVLQQHFPQSRKVFEVKPLLATQNMQLVMQALGGKLDYDI